MNDILNGRIMELKGQANLLKKGYEDWFSIRLPLYCKFTGGSGLINNLKPSVAVSMVFGVVGSP